MAESLAIWICLGHISGLVSVFFFLLHPLFIGRLTENGLQNRKKFFLDMARSENSDFWILARSHRV